MLISARMKALPLMLATSLLLFSCSDPGAYTPEYMKEDSPLDPPGTAEARAAARQKLVKEGIYVDGAVIDVKEGKAFLFRRNPDHSEDPGGRMVKSEKAKILSCEGTYYFVEMEDGQRGFLRESDLVDPVSMLTTTENFLPDGQGIFPGTDPAATGLLPDASLQFGENRILTTNQNGRNVEVVGTKTNKSQAFEEAKRQVESGQALPSVVPAPAYTGEDVPYEPLPTPTSSH